MRIIFLSSTIIISSLSLAACQYDDPKPIGRGYAAYEEEYKSAHGPKAAPVGYAFETEKNNTVIEDLRAPVADMVSKLDQKLSFAADKIYLAPPQNTAFFNSFDYVLRDELIKSGYTITQNPEKAVNIKFDAKPAQNASNSNPDTKYQAYRLALNILNADGNISQKIEGVYEIPTYGLNAAGTNYSFKGND